MGLRDLTAVAAATLDSSSSLSTVSSSVSYSHLPSLGNSTTDSCTLRHSASLQDFGHSNDEENLVLAAPDREAHEKMPSLHQSWRDASLYSSKLIKNYTARFSQGSSSRFGFKLTGVLLVLCIVFLAYISIHGLRLIWKAEKLHYAVVLDCGSTGSRVQVYSWAYKGPSDLDQLPLIKYQALPRALPRKAGWRKQNRAYNRMETEPGLDKLLKNESGVKVAIEPLVHWAQKQISSTYHSLTPIFLLATAGVRRLNEADAEWLLDKAWTILDKSPFLSKRSWVKVISGIEEAYYGWIALNYHLGRLGSTSPQWTFGALDLGGSSLQVTFESDEILHKEYRFNLTVGSAEHHLYAFSHAGFGLNDAFDKSVGMIWNNSRRNNDTKSRYIQIHHPCLNKGYQAEYRCSHCSDRFIPTGVMLVGDPDWDACKELASTVVVNSFSKVSALDPAHDCFNSPCALGKYQPVPHGQFYALSGFFVVFKFFGLLPNAHFDELLNRSKEFCLKPWKEALDSVVPQPLVEHYCFRAPYIISLVQDGLHLNEEQIVIGSGDLTWTLGAALVEAGAFVTNKLRRDAPRRMELKDSSRTLSFQNLDTGLLSFFLILIMLVFFFGATYALHCWSLLWKKPQLPVFNHPNLSIPWPPSTFFLPIHRVFTHGDPVHNGEAKYKVPHSPAPHLQDQHLRFDSLVSGDGKPMTKLTETHLIASMAYESMKMPLKCSRLSSRRTQFRDDLIKYIHK